MALSDDIVKALTQARDEIRANMDAQGINASGRTSRGFAVEVTKDGYQLVLRHDEKGSVACLPNGNRYGLTSVEVGAAPLSSLEIGREGGRVPRGFYYIIKQWTREKGLQFATESERQRFSYFTARKIVKEGTGRHKRPVKVYDVPVKKAKATISNDIRAAVVGAMTEAVKSNF